MEKRLFLILVSLLITILLMACNVYNVEKNESFQDGEQRIFKSLDDFRLYQIYRRFFSKQDLEPVAKTRVTIIDKYTTEQLNNFGIQSEPVSVDSNNEFMLEVYIDEHIDSDDFIYLINDVVVYPEKVNNYHQSIDKYVVLGHMDWVYEDYKYFENYNFYFIGLEILDGEYNRYFEGVADYIHY